MPPAGAPAPASHSPAPSTAASSRRRARWWAASRTPRPSRPARRHDVQRSALQLAMTEEERVLDGACAHAETAGVMAERGEVGLPLGDREALAAAVGLDGADREQELPGADVEDAVAPRVEQREDRRGHRHPDAGEPREQLDPPALVAGGEDGARDRADPCR